MFRFGARKSRDKIASSLESLAVQLGDHELYDEVYRICGILHNQDIHSRSWKTIDNEINLILREVPNHIRKNHMSVVKIYVERMDEFIGFRGINKSTKIDKTNRESFALKIHGAEMADKKSVEAIKKREASQENMAQMEKKLAVELREAERLDKERVVYINNAAALPPEHPDEESYIDKIKNIDTSYNNARMRITTLLQTIAQMFEYIELVKNKEFFDNLSKARVLTQDLIDVATANILAIREQEKHAQENEAIIKGVKKESGHTARTTESPKDRINNARARKHDMKDLDLSDAGNEMDIQVKNSPIVDD